MKIKFTIVFCLFISICFAQTKSLNDLKSVQEFTKNIANDFLNYDFENSFEKLKPHWALETNQIDSLKIKTQSYVPFFKENFGKPQDVVKIKEQNLNNVLYKEVYAVRFEKFIIRLVIKYYNINNAWVISTFEWDDRIQDELN